MTKKQWHISLFIFVALPLGLLSVVMSTSSKLREESYKVQGVYRLQLNAQANEVEAIENLVSIIGEEVEFFLLGEVTHGTSEFYEVRAHISQQLIQTRDISAVLVEGDWASLYHFNLFVMGKDPVLDLESKSESSVNELSRALELAAGLERWPQWMWGNRETVDFLLWLREWNSNLDSNQKRVQFLGMDTYGQWESYRAALSLLASLESGSELSKKFQQKTNCFTRYHNNPDDWAYVRTLGESQTSCPSELVAAFDFFKELKSENKLKGLSENEVFSFFQNFRVLISAEKFFRTSATEPRGATSWNSRVEHMYETIERVQSKLSGGVVVWAHNTHIGDARATDMARTGQKNIGQLFREMKGENRAFLVGFSTYSGEVLAGSQWGSPVQRMKLPLAKSESHDAYLFGLSLELGFEDFIIVFDLLEGELASKHGEQFSQTKGHRAVGVVFNPEHERYNYVPTRLSQRYDSIIFIQTTSILSAL